MDRPPLVTTARTLAVRGIQLAVVLVLLALAAGYLLGQPILLGYVTSGSMEPTIDTGDGYVAIPAALAGEPEPGDAVVFEAETHGDDDLTVHRVVDADNTGYVTQGDANPRTDQEMGEPPVRESQVVATAVQIDDEVVTIPNLGTAVVEAEHTAERVQNWVAVTLGIRWLSGASSLAFVVLIASTTLYLAETIRERWSPTQPSDTVKETNSGGIEPRYVCVGLAVLVATAALAAMTVPVGAHSIEVVSSDRPSEQPRVIEAGTTAEATYKTTNAGPVPVVSYLETDGDDMAVDTTELSLGYREEFETTVELTAPEETGYYQMFVVEQRYLYVLPAPVIETLHGIHPWIARGTIVGILGGMTYVLTRSLIGTAPAYSQLNRSSASPNGSLCRRLLRRLY
ncbi:peptidase S26 domain protein [Natrialba magadii ATCC 43099]|uniref:Peptidase S26 domain protein n=1 Tax=Natrialba magadii (strain ATCC 43099 / DSM 3394 / CCM 3739 / CIP 104546 / IAM 13178 / JCM 8861 / NBRC 102185 / NCIMB 2190 / MS3) TaxID=547559 RepID=D3ST58_NATMM|nr:signal peptidase I [Natrialba magadii]ADD06925.1 peptidase S26 domain protein [Natrialba magadii ATCC 43099]ELY28451.1 peptidase S26B, signal peptidase [Natrialba magadii ATCC 43099]